MSQGRRRLAAVMFTDMVGYTALGQKNESLSLALVEEQRKLVRPILARHDGREVKTIGDAFLVEFPNALDSVRCAYDIQRVMREFNISMPEDRRIHLRVGIHLGDVIEFGGDISGDAVNVASRIESLAEDGGVCITHQVYESVQNKFELPFVSMGFKPLKNVNTPMEVFKILMPWNKENSEAPLQLETKRIAVLPFVSMSPDPNDEYFADGLTEELIDKLCKVRGLEVIARTSIMRYKKGEARAGDIGNELRAGSLVEGSVRKAGGKVRVTAQLIDATTEGHLWSSTYDRELEDVFSIQSDIAEQVAGALKVQLLPSEKQVIEQRRTENMGAYTLYLKGRYFWNKRGLEDLRKAAEYFAESVKEDSGFALGYAGLADCHYLIAANWQVDFESNRFKATEMVSKALELDPDLAEAHATRGGLLLLDYNQKEAELEFKRAVHLNPNYATAHQWYSQLLLGELKWEDALHEIEKALDLDPLSPTINMNHSSYYFYKRDYSRALDLARKAFELNPSGFLRFNLMYSYGMTKQFEDARREGVTGAKLMQDIYPRADKGVEVFLAFLEDDRQMVAELLPEVEARFEESAFDAAGIAGLHFYLGHDDAGFEWLERSYQRREEALWFLALDLRFDNIRADPRYFSFLERLGLGFLKYRNEGSNPLGPDP